MVRRLGERIQHEGLKINAVATSDGHPASPAVSEFRSRSSTPSSALDINLDGADEIDRKFRMIKGRGGALLREKIVACASNHRVTMIAADKRVERLGTRSRFPSRSARSASSTPSDDCSSSAVRPTIRLPAGRLAVQDRRRQPDHRLPVRAPSTIPESLDRELQCIAGVLETGLFIGLCDTLIVGTPTGPERSNRRHANRGR